MISRDHTVAHVDLPLAGDGSNRESIDALAAVRALVPATIGNVSGTTVDVGGDAAATKDGNDNLATHAPLVFGFVLAMAFLLLLVTFRSIVIPIKAILLNLLSVAAAFGVLTMVFQHGLGESIGMPHTKGVASWLPVFLFVILFGLSMDYHVFILSRIKEGWDEGIGNDAAVEQGIRGSAGVVTAAAAVMVAVFSIFATLSLVDLQEFGVGLAVAVALDATLIRGVVLPAAMKLLGKWNWYMPRSLAWMPSLGHGEQRRAAGRRRVARAPHRGTTRRPALRGGPSAFGRAELGAPHKAYTARVKTASADPSEASPDGARRPRAARRLPHPRARDQRLPACVPRLRRVRADAAPGHGRDEPRLRAPLRERAPRRRTRSPPRRPRPTRARATRWRRSSARAAGASACSCATRPRGSTSSPTPTATRTAGRAT